MVKELTECKIMVGQNGLIWINGPDGNKEVIAVEAIEMISEKTQTSNLTERVKEFLEKRIKENV